MLLGRQGVDTKCKQSFLPNAIANILRMYRQSLLPTNISEDNVGAISWEVKKWGSKSPARPWT